MRSSPSSLPARRTLAAALVVFLASTALGCSRTTPASETTITLPPSTTLVDSLRTTGIAPEGASLTELAAEAYLWGYPLVASSRNYQRLAVLGDPNELVWIPPLPDASLRFVVAPNHDTAYGGAVLDLRVGPQVLTLPTVTDRYWSAQFLDAWTEAYAYLGTRVDGGQGGTWAIVPPGWQGTLPDGMGRIDSPTMHTFLLIRYRVSGPGDVAAVQAVQAQVSLRPLDPDAPVAPPHDPANTTGTPENTAAAGIGFFDELGRLLAIDGPATPHDRERMARYEALGIGPGRTPSTQVTDPAVREALAAGVALGEEALVADTLTTAEDVNGWRLERTLGTWGPRQVLERAGTARIAYAANIAAEALYGFARTDVDGVPLDGTHTYRLRFPAGTPPVGPLGFWSVTLYGPDQFFVANPLGRYAVGEGRGAFTRNPDGTAEILIGAEPPPGEPANWLPAPRGPFQLAFRAYLPTGGLLDGSWQVPGVERIG